ncbi:hypothetical protein AMK29_02715 [Streptomyces sp. CB02261]|nr:hypothetical protein AMK29_02715 [Streptomyces sp. CB02261]
MGRMPDALLRADASVGPDAPVRADAPVGPDASVLADAPVRADARWAGCHCGPGAPVGPKAPGSSARL